MKPTEPATEPVNSKSQEPIAIVGIGCRFPGDADNPRKFWELMTNGIDAISEVPTDRWNTDKFYDPAPAVPGRTQARLGGFVRNVDSFDADFFRIPPREAACVDPQQRMLLETAWEAMEDGGISIDPEVGGNIGVYVGISTSDYGTAQTDLKDGGKIDMYTPTGGATSIAANRISYCFNLRGPSLSVDTACSSSLVALHLACRSLLNGECEAVLAGGVNFILNPDTYVGFSRMSMLSPDGRCKPFDARGNGFTRGEGAGMLLLKPLSAARRANDRIYAVIRGTAVNQDGSDSAGMTMPARSSQEAVIKAACSRAGIEPGQISYVEAHGTGTPVGDPVEALALGTVIGKNRPGKNPLYIGSVKSNIGHLESGAGIAGITKAALVLYHRTIPPSLHFETPNPGIDFKGLNLQVTAKPVSLPRNEKSIFAGVNSFGFGGTNAHVVLESCPQANDCRKHSGTVGLGGAEILPLSARSQSSLRGLAASFGEALKGGGSVNGSSWRDICHTMAVRRFHHQDFRGAVVARDRAEAVACLQAIAEGDLHPGWCGNDERVARGDDRVVFVFCGQGPQWFAMGRELMGEDPVFRSKMEECDRLVRELGDWSLLDELAAEEKDSRIQDTSFGQPAIFAIQVALAERWKAWGIVPSAVVGHSVGEVAAAHVAGVLTLEEAVRVIFHRGRCMAKAGEGAMLAAGLSRADALEMLSAYGDRVCLAASNGPASVTLSGEAATLDEIGRELDSRGIFQKRLRVSYAFHSNQMDPIEEELLESLAGLAPVKAKLPLYSTVSGELTTGEDFGADYWWQNVRQAVRFCEAIEGLAEEGYQNFLELGPHPVLTASITETLRVHGKTGHVFASLRRKEAERATLLKTVGDMFAAGLQVDWRSLCPGQFVALPGYVWSREYYWNESENHRHYRLGNRMHPFLGENRNGAEPSWESLLGTRARDLIEDHRVQGRALFPAAGYVEMALEAAGQTLGDDVSYDLEGVEFLKAFFMPSSDDPCTMRLIFDPETNEFRIYSEMTGQSGWVKHCCGEFHEVPESHREPADRYESFDEEGNPFLPGGEEFAVETCYKMFEKCGIQYGPKFRGLKKLYRKDGEALGLVKISEEANFPNDRFHLNPALLDSCFHAVLMANPNSFDDKPATVFLPARIDRVRFYRDAPEEVWSHVTLTVIGREVIEATILLFDTKGNIIAEIEGFTCHAAGSGAVDPTGDWLYNFDFESRDLPGVETPCLPGEYLPPIEVLADQVREGVSQGGKHESWGHLYQYRKPEIDTLCQVYIRRALSELGWSPNPGTEFSPVELAADLGVEDHHQKVFERFLQILAEDGFLESTEGGWIVKRWEAIEDPEELWQKGINNFPAYHMEYVVMRKMGRELGRILRGKSDPYQMLFEQGGSLTDDLFARGWSMRRGNQMVSEAVKNAISRLPQGRKLRILELGAGTGGLSEWILRSLPEETSRYVFSDISTRFLGKAEERFAEYPFVEFRGLDMEESPLKQGFEPGSFDLVLASNALHATSDLSRTIRRIREVIAPGGMLALLEFVTPLRWHELVFGTMDSWWAMTDRRVDSLCPLLSADRWQSVLKKAGMPSSAVVDSDDGCQSLILASEPEVKIPAESAPIGVPEGDQEDAGAWLLFADRKGLAVSVAESLRSKGHRVVLFKNGKPRKTGSRKSSTDEVFLPAGNPELIEAEMAALPELRGIVHFWSLDLEEPVSSDGAFQEMERNLLSVVQLVQSATGSKSNSLPKLWLVTRGAQPDREGSIVSVSQAPVLGLARTINTEHPSLLCRSIDLQPGEGSEADPIRILAELTVQDEENEILLRGEGRYCPRLVRTTVARRWSEMRDSSEISYGLSIAQPGVIDSMMLTPRPRVEPGPGQIEIEVISGALNFRDVMKALGIYPTEGDEELRLGDECAGRVLRIGEGVTNVKPGDRVTAIAMGCFGSHATTLADFAMQCPDTMQLDEAVTLPVAFLTAAYGLEHLAGIAKGERVLIHAATGGVGLAAIQIARQAGAEIFATAGSPEKRDFLRGLGIKHVMDSRSLSFYDEIREITNGEGIDIVLNSLAGQAIARSLSLLRDYGRFLEIGKRDIYQNTRIGLRSFRKNISYHAIDLSRTFSDRVPLVRTILDGLSKRFHDGTLTPLPQLVFSQSQIPAAFRAMRQARHMGKLVISFTEKQVPIGFTSQAGDSPVRADGTYLVTGGTSGFGLESARWLADQGAGALILMSRSGATSEETRDAIAAMEKKGVRVLAPKADVCSWKEVGAVLEEIKNSDLPPLRGIFHAAMVLDDASLLDQNPERFHRTFAPKAQGGWVLHKLTEDLDLDFFTLYSSINSVIGSPGQANYAAANVFLEALAHFRHSSGKPGLAINWGHIGETGVASRNKKIIEHLNRSGFPAMNPRTCVEVKGSLLRHGHTQAIVADLDWKLMEGSVIRADKSPRFVRILSEIDSSDSEMDSARIRERILSCDEEEQQEVMREYLHKLVARVLRTSPSKLDVNRPLMDLGLDSLMAVELINRIEGDLGVGVPTGQLATQSICDLSGIILPLLTGKSTTAAVGAGPVSAPSQGDKVEEIVPAARVTVDFVGQLDRLNKELDSLIRPDLTLREIKKGPSGKPSLKVTFCHASDLAPAELLNVLRQRFAMYSNKNLFGTSSKNRLVAIPDQLRNALSEERGKEIPDKIDPVAYQIDFDEYDFESTCYHLTIGVENRLVAYLRLIFEEDGQLMSAREIYDREIDKISKGGLSAEISRLIHPGGNGAVSGDILELQRRVGLQMFELVDQFAARKGIRHLFAQVHPVHGAIYEENGVLSQEGPERPCPSVNNAPAVLMHRPIISQLSTSGVV